MAHSCPACLSSFATARGVATHRRHCRAYKNLPATVLQAHLDAFQQVQADRDAMNTQEHHDGELGMDIDSPHLQVSLDASVTSLAQIFWFLTVYTIV